MPSPDFYKSVFVNCPFDDEYRRILHAVLFCLIRFGLKPRIASERTDSGEPRLEKIMELISNSKYAIHDLNRCQSTSQGDYHRISTPVD